MLLTSLLGLLSTVSPLSEVSEELLLMRLGRLELPRPKTHVPETCASTNSATTAWLSPCGDWPNLHHGTPDRVLPATNGRTGWYRGTDRLLSHIVLHPENPCYDRVFPWPVDSGSAI
jgi:hypothetical protein